MEGSQHTYSKLSSAFALSAAFFQPRVKSHTYAILLQEKILLFLMIFSFNGFWWDKSNDDDIFLDFDTLMKINEKL